MSNASYDAPAAELDVEVHDDGPEAYDELKRLFESDRRAGGSTPIWAPDEWHPDYAHLLIAEKKGVAAAHNFSLTPDVLDLLIAANSYQPKGPADTFVFAIRGGELAQGNAFEDVAKVDLNDVRPDHKDTHCTIGFYYRKTRTLSAFKGSTVPNVGSVAAYYKIVNHLAAQSDFKCNMLPTGLYRYRVGSHVGKSHAAVTPALQLANYYRPSESGRVTVLRTTDQPSYRHDGFWDLCAPGDNVHCAFRNTGFSSCGCLTIQGNDGEGPFGRFQSVLNKFGQGKAVDVMIVTGKEAAIAAALIAKGQAQQADLVDACLRRLRGGSEGPAVTALQAALGMPSPTGLFDGETRQLLVERERKLGRADVKSDAIFSPLDEAAFGWNVFKAAPGAPVATAPVPQTVPVPQTAPVAQTAAVSPSSLPVGLAGLKPETLILIAGPTNSQISADFKTLTVPGEGVWRVGPASGTVNFAPEANFSGRTQPIRYEIHDIYNRAATAVASVTVASASRPPLLSPDDARTFAGQHVSVSVLMNDVAVDGEIDPTTLQFAETPGGTLTANRQSLTVPGQGVWSVTSNGTVDFSPYASFIGVARATYQVASKLGAVATSTVTVTVDPERGPLLLGDDTATTPHGQTVTIDVLKNDSIGPVATGAVLVAPLTPTTPGTPATPVVVTSPNVTSASTSQATSATAGAALPAGAVRITPEAIAQLAPRAMPKYAQAFASRGDQILAQYGINANAKRLSHFMAQLAHESSGFSLDRENLNYGSAARLCQVWPARFPSEDAAAPYVRNEEKLANRVYGDRLGNNQPGDGYKFRGRGLIQITGRANYAEHGQKLNIDLVNSPDLALDGEHAIRIAAMFWNSRAKSSGRSMNELADDDNIEQITRRINGGLTGLPDRRARFDKAWAIWGSGRSPRSAPDMGDLERGDTGDRVRRLEELLARAGYDPGAIDGEFDGRTERAVMLFQNDNRRNVDGRVTSDLWQLLENAPQRQATAAKRSPGDGARCRIRPSDRDPRTLDHRPSWAARHRELLRLLAAILVVGALATLTLGSIGASTPASAAAFGPSLAWPAGLSALAALLWMLTALVGGRNQPLHREAEVNPPAAPGPSGMGAAGMSEAPAPSAGSQSAVANRSEAADDEALRKLGVDPAEFEESEPIRAMPAQGDDPGDPSPPPDRSQPQMLVPVGVRPQASPSVRGASARGLEPFDVASGDARFAIIGMFGGDNNLTNQVDYNLNQMVTANRTGGVVSVLALVDLENKPASVIEITPRGEQRVIAQMGEIDTGDPETLAKFLSRALISYPNAKKAIGFWDHGSGVFKEQDPNEVVLTRSIRGAQDRKGPARRLLIPAAERAAMMAARDKRAMLHDNSGGVLTNLEAGHMLEAAFSRAGQSGPVDLIYSDTCLNGMIEVLEELGHYGQTVVASAETEPGNGWNYEGWLSRMARQSPQSPDDWGRHAVDAFADGYKARTDQHPCTLGAFRSDNLIAERFAELVQVAARGGIGAWSLMTIARSRTQQYDTRDSYDLIGFARQLAAIAAQDAPELAAKARAVDQAAREARICHVWLGNDVRGAEGLAFWFPGSTGSFEADNGTYRRLSFAKSTGWADYLGRMYPPAA